ncbi:unnamed protein product [Polarella glacialis]|uniref:Bifunctional lysine-specific demethylase and histidyl-hydroxylase n=1 Tax=Polarella glacialis TaxID=89957 RepID=A0A813HK50_POLGL|nr:unnamed protein product [Polarella glacialis]
MVSCSRVQYFEPVDDDPCSEEALFSLLDLQHLAAELREPQLRLWRQVVPDACLPANFAGLFRALASSSTFKELWLATGSGNGHMRGPFLLPRLAFVEGLLTLQDVADGLSTATQAGEGIPAALGLLRPDEPEEKINSELPPVLSLAELQELLNFGTVFVNGASKHWRSLAAVCRDVGAALGFPANVNIYATAPGRDVSTPVHTDHHDVLVLQTQGCKRWRVFRPPQRLAGAHPCHRGKGQDTLESHELDTPIVDVVLRPGECLFVPCGFPHATSTFLGSCGTSERSSSSPVQEPSSTASVHLTLGISAADCGLTYGTLRGQLLLELGLESLGDEELDDDAFWALYSPLRLGCLAPEDESDEAAVQRLARDLERLVLEVDLAGQEPIEEEAVEELHEAAVLVATRWHRIWADMLEIHDRGYMEIIIAPRGGPTVALGLVGTSSFHSRQRRCRSDWLGSEEDMPDCDAEEAAAAADPNIALATRSVGNFCDFIRAHLPEAEHAWTRPVTAGTASAVAAAAKLRFVAID